MTLEITCLVIRRFRQLCAQLSIPRFFLRQLDLQSLDLLHQLLRAGKKGREGLCASTLRFFFFNIIGGKNDDIRRQVCMCVCARSMRLKANANQLTEIVLAARKKIARRISNVYKVG